MGGIERPNPYGLIGKAGEHFQLTAKRLDYAPQCGHLHVRLALQFGERRLLDAKRSGKLTLTFSRKRSHF